MGYIFLLAVFLLGSALFCAYQVDKMDNENLRNQVLECQTELQLYKEINNELIMRIE